jgi:hypothetical protein
MVMVGVDGRESMEVLVTNIRPGPELSATVTLVPYAEGVFDAEDGPIPPWDALVTQPREAVVPFIDIVTSDETALVRDADGSHKLGIVIRLRRSSTARSHTVTGIQLSAQESGTGDPARYREFPASAEVLRFDDVKKGETYTLRVRYILGNGKKGQPQYGGWSPAVTHSLASPKLAPSNVTVAYIAGDRVSWLTPPLPPDHAGYRVRFAVYAGQSWERAEVLTDGLILTDYVLLAEVPTDAVELLVKAETAAKVQSEVAGRVTVAGVPRPRAYRVFIEDLGAQNWPGTLTGGERIEGELRAIDKSVWLGPPQGDWLAPQSAPWLAPSSETMVWEFDYICPTGIKPTDYLLFERTGLGDLYVTYQWATDQIEYYEGGIMPPEEETFPPPWVPLGAFVSDTVSGRPFLPWRDGLRPVAGEIIHFRVTTRGGTALRGVLTAARVVVMGQMITQAVPDFQVPLIGGRLPVAGVFRTIEWVHYMLDDASVATTIKRLDKNVAQGPLVKGYGTDQQPAVAIADFTIGGA